MSKQDILLEQALSEIAAEETRAMEQQMTFADMQAAKRMQTEHKKDALALIRKNTKSFSPAPYLRAAAVLVVLLGGLWMLRSLPTEKNTLPPEVQQLQPIYTQMPAAGLPTATAQLPTSTPVFVLKESNAPTPAPQYTAAAPVEPTQFPTLASTSTPAMIPTSVPTSTPTPTLSPTLTPTATPVPTLAPTATPTLAPTAVPVPVATPVPTYQPNGWQGDYFPQVHEGQWTIKKNDANNLTIAVYDDSYEFWEYTEKVILPLTEAEDCRFHYLSINGTPALLTEDKAGQLTLTWDVEDRTLSLFTPIGDEETLHSLAETVNRTSP